MFTDQALAIMQGGEFDGDWTTALPYAFAAGSPSGAVTRSRDDNSLHEPLGSGGCSPTRSR